LQIKNKISGAKMRHKITILGLLLLMVGVAFAQKAYIKIEGMSPHVLEGMGIMNLDSVSSGLPVVGTGTVVWLRGYDVSGDTAFKNATSYEWSIVGRPTGSNATLSATNQQLVTFKPDVAGSYQVKLVVNGVDDTTITIIAANYTGVNWKDLSGAPFNCASCHKSVTPEIYNKWVSSGHATIFERGMNGKLAPYWGPNCWRCHTTGYNTMANNGGFDDVATQLGFDWNQWKPPRAGLFDSLLTTDKKMLSLVATIGCENCHGPKNPNHFGAGTQPKTMSAEVCAQCHNEPWRHNRYVQWEYSGHAESVWSNSFRSSGTTTIQPGQYNLNVCVRCHDGAGFVAFVKNEEFDNRISTGYSRIKHTTITCQTCHDPHSMELRQAPTTADTLANGFNYSSIDLGKGKICVNCHKYRRNALTYVTTSLSSTWGPHHAGAGDVYLGQNGYTWGVNLPSSVGHRLVENACVGCHMSATPDTGHVARDKIGMHTWKMKYIAPDGQEYDNITGCVKCHTGITKFDDIMASYDYDMDGTIEPFMKEVDGLVEKLAMALPPRGQPTVDWQLIRTDPDSVRLKQAYWNYRYVTEDKSHGVHNPKYVVALLQLSISKLTGVEFTQPEIPVAFELYQNYPNPFNPSTKIGFALPRESKVKLEVFNVLGERVAVLKDEVMPAGVHVVEFNATGLSSGVYFYRLTAGDFVATKKMVLMK
jgi:hypothetical protein